MFGTGKRAEERRLHPCAIQGDALGSASRGASVIAGGQGLLSARSVFVSSVGTPALPGRWSPAMGSMGGTGFPRLRPFRAVDCCVVVCAIGNTFCMSLFVRRPQDMLWWVVVAAIASAFAGLAVSFMWRYAVPRLLIVADPPPPGDPGDIGYIRTYDYMQYVSGPDWGRITSLAMALSVVAGVAVAFLGCWISRSSAPPFKPGHLVAAPIVAGAIVGAVLVWRSRRDPPKLYFRMIVDPSFSDFGPDGLPREEISGAPPMFDVANAAVLLPATGAAVGGIVFGVFLTIIALLRKRKELQHRASGVPDDAS